MNLLTMANPARLWTVNEAAGMGMFFSQRVCATCEPDHSVSLSSFDATPLSSPDRESPLEGVTAGAHFFAFQRIDLTTMQVHAYSSDAGSFGDFLWVSPPVESGDAVALDDALVVLSDATGRVLVHSGVSGPGTWTDAGIDGAMELGPVSDGAFALVGTEAGEVFSVDAAGTATSLGSVPGWEAHSGAAGVSRSYLAGNAQLLIWLVEVPNPRVYLRAR